APLGGSGSFLRRLGSIVLLERARRGIVLLGDFLGAGRRRGHGPGSRLGARRRRGRDRFLARHQRTGGAHDQRTHAARPDGNEFLRRLGVLLGRFGRETVLVLGQRGDLVFLVGRRGASRRFAGCRQHDARLGLGGNIDRLFLGLDQGFLRRQAILATGNPFIDRLVLIGGDRAAGIGRLHLDRILVGPHQRRVIGIVADRKSTRLNSS